MSTSGAIRAGRAFVEIMGDDSKLQRTLEGTEQRLRKWGAATVAIGAAVGTAMAAAATSFAASAAATGKLALQTGASVGELGLLEHVAKRLGIDFEDMTGAIEELNIRLGEAIRDGVGPAHEALQQLGLDSRELARMPVTEQLKTIAAALRNIESPQLRGFLADEIFGGDAYKILPFLRQTTEAMSAMIEEGRALGVEFTDGEVEAAKELNAALQRLWTVLDVGVNIIGGTLAPLMTELVDITTGYLVAIKDWIAGHKDAVVLAARLAFYVAAFGSGLLAGAAAIRVIMGVMMAYRAAIAAVVAAKTVLLAMSGPKGWALLAAGALAAGAALGYVQQQFDEIEQRAAAAQKKIRQTLNAAEQAKGTDGGMSFGGAADRKPAKLDVGGIFADLDRVNARIAQLREVGEDAWAGIPMLIQRETEAALTEISGTLEAFAQQSEPPIRNLHRALHDVLQLVEQTGATNADGVIAGLKEQIAEASGLAAEMERVEQELAAIKGHGTLEQLLAAGALPEQVAELRDRMEELAGLKATEELTESIAGLEQELDLLQGKITETDVALAGLAEADVPQALIDYYRQLRGEIDKTKQAQDQLAEDEREAESIRERTRTPGESFDADFARLKELREKDLLDPETFARATQQLLEQRASGLSAAGEAADQKSASVAGSFNARAAAGLGATGPERELASNTKKLVELAKQQLQTLRDQNPGLFT